MKLKAYRISTGVMTHYAFAAGDTADALAEDFYDWAPDVTEVPVDEAVAYMVQHNTVVEVV